MLTSTEAKERMAVLMLRRNELFGGKAGSADPVLNQQIGEVELLIQRFGEICAGTPGVREHMWCWMVDIIGSDSGLEIRRGEGITPGTLTEVIPALAGYTGGKLEFESKTSSLMASVSAAISGEGFYISDRGAGCSDWHLGVPCNTNACDKLCAFLHERFARAITCELLVIRPRFWGWRFKGLSNVAEAQVFLNGP
jgi:hypothetical protein